MRTWHPLYDVDEVEPGVWTLSAQFEDTYGRISLRRTVDGPRYRVEFRGNLIGWATTLRTAVERVHQAYIASHGPAGGSISSWGERPPRPAS